MLHFGAVHSMVRVLDFGGVFRRRFSTEFTAAMALPIDAAKQSRTRKVKGARSCIRALLGLRSQWMVRLGLQYTAISTSASGSGLTFDGEGKHDLCRT